MEHHKTLSRQCKAACYVSRQAIIFSQTLLDMYSKEVRHIAIRMYNTMNSLRKVADIVGTSHSTISRWVKHPTPQPSMRRLRTHMMEQPVLDCLRLRLASNPFSTCSELAVMVKTTFGFNCSRQLVSLALKKHLGFSRKVAHYVGKPNEEKTAAFLALRNKYTVEGRQFFIFDETGFQHGIGFKRGYNKRGERLRFVTKLYGTNISVLAVIDNTSLIAYEKSNCPYNRVMFLDFLKLHESCFPKGSVLVMDNVAFHHCKEVKAYVASMGWEFLYTPPYSPWFSPIEGVFSLVKNHYRKNRCIDDAFSVDLKVQSFFRHSWSLTTEQK